MKVSFFPPLLFTLILILVVKGLFLSIRVSEEANYALDTSATSVLLDTAYAAQAGNSTDVNPSNSTPIEQSKTSVSFTEPAKIAGEDTPNVPSPIQNVQVQSQDNNDAQPVSLLDDKLNMNKSELKLLKELTKRRELLEKNNEDLRSKEQVLKETEEKIEEKMGELRSLQSKLEGMVKQHEQDENKKIASLVKIYENMRPRDAAKIFDELEMPVLIQVVRNMKEIKVAPILASMHPIKARDLSIELANTKSLSSN